MSLSHFWFFICWWGAGEVHLTLFHPSGYITFPRFMSILPGEAFVPAALAGKKRLRCWVSEYLCVVGGSGGGECVCQHLWYTQDWGVFVSVCHWLINLWLCEGECISVSEPLCGCVSVSDRCVGSGLQSCWHCDLALLSPVGTSGPRRSRSAGTAPSRDCLSCGGACTPGPLSAQVYRCVTRSVWHSTDPGSSLTIAGMCHLLGLEMVREGTRYKTKTKWRQQQQIHWNFICLLFSSVK